MVVGMTLVVQKTKIGKEIRQVERFFLRGEDHLQQILKQRGHCQGRDQGCLFRCAAQRTIGKTLDQHADNDTDEDRDDYD